MSPRPLPLVHAELPLSEHLQGAGIRLSSDGIQESLASLACTWNREQATGVMLEHLARQGPRLGSVRLPAAEFGRRLTLASRAIEAAGVHPDEVIRVALGVAAQRLLVEGDPATIPGVQVIDLLGRLAAVDYALLDVTASGQILLYDKSPSRAVLGDELPGVKLDDRRPELPPNVRMPDDVLRVLETHFPKLSVESVRQSSHRLRRLGLFSQDHVYGQPSHVGREVLRLSKSERG